MFLRIVRDIAKPQQFAILDLLKQSTGMSVGEMSATLRLSYMGVKQHCQELERKGLLDTWRRRTEIGRPEMLYRLTSRATGLYPEAGNEMTLAILQAIQQVYGKAAPDKLLYHYFMDMGARYSGKLKAGSLLDRATALAKLRNQEGRCTRVERDAEGGFRLVEFHCPLKEIAEVYPGVRQMETRMLGQILQTEVQRSEERQSGLLRIDWILPALSGAPAEKVAEVPVHPEMGRVEPVSPLVPVEKARPAPASSLELELDHAPALSSAPAA